MQKLITPTALKRAIHKHLIESGFLKNSRGYHVPDNLNKQDIRDLHSNNRRDRLKLDQKLILEKGVDLIQHFASGREVNPEKIDPEIIEVNSGTSESDLFRFATAIWSVPVSKGYGRRIRFLVKDRHNSKLIGIFALGDPVFNLSARDNWIGWNAQDRKERLVHVMDAYVVGAVPPYSKLIGGKLVASLIASNVVKKIYEKKYLHRKSIISGKKKRPRLVLVTTTSALGRSSLYNRLKLPEGLSFIKIGNTKGFGHFHLSGKIFDMIRQYLEQNNHPYANGHQFGSGPNWRIRVVRAGLETIGLNGDDFLRHGIKREVYAMPLAKNWKQILLGKNKNCQSLSLPAEKISEYCINRWTIPRSIRDKRYKMFCPSSILKYLTNGGPPSSW